MSACDIICNVYANHSPNNDLKTKEMKKKENKKKDSQLSSTTTHFITEEMRLLKIGPCFMSTDIQEIGLGLVIVGRIHQSGKISIAFFLVDSFCLGVKDCGYKLYLKQDEIEDILNMFYNFDFKPCSYEEAHNMIYGAVHFAEKGGVKPNENFELMKYFLAEDNAEIPHIAYEFGRNGEHYLCAKDKEELNRFLPLLQKTLGKEVEYIILDEDTEEEEIEEYSERESEYTFKIPDYPRQVTLIHPWVYKELAKEYDKGLPDEQTISKLLDLPHDELRHDLEQIILYKLGQFHRVPVKKQKEDSVVLAAVILLSVVGNEESLGCVLECLHQPEVFYDLYIGDFIVESIMPTLYFTGKNQLKKLMEEMKIPGLYPFAKSVIPEAVLRIAIETPERRAEVVAWFHELLQFIIHDPQHGASVPPVLVGLILDDIITLKAFELLPECKTIIKERLADEDTFSDLEDIEQLMIEEKEQMKLTLDYREIIKCLRGEKDSFGVGMN